MKKLFTSLTLCSIMLTSCAQSSAQPVFVHSGDHNKYRDSGLSLKSDIPVDFVPEDYKIVSLGDSLTQGVGDSTKRGGYLPYLEDHLEKEKGVKDAQFLNFGVSGNKTSQLLKRLDKDEVKEAIGETDMVIITIGGNDIMKVVRENFTTLDLSDFDKQRMVYEQNLISILDFIRAENPQTTIILVGLYNPFSKWFADVKEIDMIMEGWNEKSKAILSKYEESYFVDIADTFKNTEENLLYKDYFHPNDKGYELMALKVYEILRKQALPTLSETKYALRKEENYYNE